MSTEITGRGWAFPPQLNSQGKLALTTEQSEIDQAIQIILSTSPGQRVMRPTFGCRLQELVFAPNNSQTMGEARRFVEEALAMWEPRIHVRRINVSTDPEDTCRMLIELEYEVKLTRDRRTLIYPYYRILEE